MSFDATQVRLARVIVVANEKGGSGKSTIAMHVAIALLKRGLRVATVDLDARQRSLTHYVENRRAWAARAGRALETPEHVCLDEAGAAENDLAASKLLYDAIDPLTQGHDAVIVDTPGHDGHLMRLVHSIADTLITPLNDSFVDLDVLGRFDAETNGVTGLSHYARTVEETRRQRRIKGLPATDWIVLRNRLSMLTTRNKRLVGASLQELAERLDFRAVEGLAERMIFREFFLRGLTALDELDEATLGTRPTLSHVTARQEVDSLLDAMKLDALVGAAESDQAQERSRDAA